MAVKEAAQRCPHGIYVPDDPPRYAQAFEAVLDVLDRFSPLVEDAGVGLAFADAAGLGPLYGADASLGARVRRDVEAGTGQAAHVGLATGRLAAEVAARTAGDAAVAVVSSNDRAYLAEQPVDRLPLPERTIAHLRALGIATIGAFAGLPANAVRTRYGTEGAQAWRLAHGEDPQPLKGRTQPIVLREAIDFEWEEHNVDRLTFALQALAQRLATRLANRGLMAQQVGSQIERSDGTVQQFALALPEPSAGAATLRDAARWRLEAWAGATQADAAVQEILTPTEPGVVRIGLDVQHLVPGAGTQRSLLGNRSERVARANHAMSRLRAQLGDDAVFRMELCPDAWTLETASRRIDAYVETGAPRDALHALCGVAGRPGGRARPDAALHTAPSGPHQRDRRRQPGDDRWDDQEGGRPLRAAAGADRVVGGSHRPRLPARAAGRRPRVGALSRPRPGALVCPGGPRLTGPAYAELHAHSNFSFLDGASHPEEMAARAAELGLAALAITDHDGVYGAVRFCHAARELGLHPIVGMEASMAGGHHLTLLARDREGYANICRLATAAHHDRPKGTAELDLDTLARHARGLVGLSGCLQGAIPAAALGGDNGQAIDLAGTYAEMFEPGSFFLELQDHRLEAEHLAGAGLLEVARQTALPLVATNNVHYHDRARARLQDVLVCIKHTTTLETAGRRLRPNHEFALKSAEEMARLFTSVPEAITNTLRIAAMCEFDLSRKLEYGLPAYPTPNGKSEYGYMERLVWEGARRRYPDLDETVRQRVRQELRIRQGPGAGGLFPHGPRPGGLLSSQRHPGQHARLGAGLDSSVTPSTSRWSTPSPPG